MTSFTCIVWEHRSKNRISRMCVLHTWYYRVCCVFTRTSLSVFCISCCLLVYLVLVLRFWGEQVYNRVRTDSVKVWKVVEFKVEIFQDWKIIENDLRYEKVWKSHGKCDWWSGKLRCSLSGTLWIFQHLLLSCAKVQSGYPDAWDHGW